MKTINFETNDFALTTNVLWIMQSSYQLIQQMSSLIGEKFVISGCAVNGTSVAPGIVCIDGEIMSTTGGSYERCSVEPTPTTEEIQDGSYTVTEKKLVFASSGDFSWSEVKSLSTLEALIGTVAGKEPSISRNTGFNLNKSDAVTNDSSTNLATSKAVKTAYDKGVTALVAANAAQSTADSKEPSISKNSGFNLNKSDAATSSLSTVLATSKAVKTAYDKGVTALVAANAAQSTADSKMPAAVNITGTDLNDYKTYGHYYCVNNGLASAISNCPVGEAFNLDVNYVNDDVCIQRLTTYMKSANRVFVRSYEYYNGEGVWGEWLEIETKASALGSFAPLNKVHVFSWTSGTLQLPNTANVFVASPDGISGDWATVALPSKGNHIRDGIEVSVSWARADNYAESIHIYAPSGYSFHGGATRYDMANNQGMTFVLQGNVYYAICKGASFH